MNHVRNSCQHITADYDDGSSVGYQMQQWAGSSRGGTLLAVIITAAEMHRTVNGDMDVDVDVDVCVDIDIYIDIEIYIYI